MASLTGKISNPILRQVIGAVREHLRVPLFASAYTLITNQVLTSGVGYLYWVLAARLYPVEVVGENSALLSTILLLASFSELCFKAAMTRFVPRAGKSTPKLLTYALLINLSVALVIGLFVVTIGRYIPLTASLLEDVDIWPGWMVIAAMFWVVFYVQDGILTGMRQTKWVVIKNTLYSVLKLLLLVACLWFASDYGIVISWFAVVPFLVVLFTALAFLRFMPAHVSTDISLTRPVTIQEMIKSIGGDYIGSLLADTCERTLPLIVLSMLGAGSTAYFYQGWSLATPIFSVASNMASAFTVEASADMSRVMHNSRRILRQMLLIISLLVAGIWVIAPLLLSVFGSNYARESTALLRWVVVAAIPLSINVWYLSYARVFSDVKSIIFVQGLICGITLLVGYTWIRSYGITSIGVAWFLAHSIAAAFVLIKMGPRLLLKEEVSVDHSESRNNLLRRVDWRLLIPVGRIHKSACFTSGPLAHSICAISDQAVTPQTGMAGDCDLVAAVDPDEAQLLAMRAALGSDGVCYTEWSAWRKGWAKGIRQRLEQAGFSDLYLFWPYPNADHPRFFFPQQSETAPIRYLVDQMLAGSFPLPSIIKQLAVWSLGWVLQSGCLPHLCVLAYPNTSHTPITFDRISNELLKDVKINGQLSYLVRTDGAQLNNKIIYLVFSESDSNPRWVIKLSRTPEDAQTLCSEEEILLKLASSNAKAGSGWQIPQVIYAGEINTAWFSCQTALRGTPLYHYLCKENARDVAMSMAAWQLKLALWSHSERQSSTQLLVERLSNNLEKVAGGALTPEEITQTRTALKSIDRLPAVCAHNDFTPWNMTWEPDGLGVFDWTDANWDSAPMLDLVYGLANLFFTLEHTWEAASMRETYGAVIDPDTEAGRVFNEALAHYACGLGIKPAQVSALRLLTWVLHSSFEYENGLVEGNGQVAGDTVKRICLPLWKAELAHVQSEIHEVINA